MGSFQSWLRTRWFAMVGALLTAVVLLAAGWELLDIYRARLVVDAKEAVLSSVSSQVAALTVAVDRRLSVVSALRAFAVVDPSPARLDAEFETYVADLYASVDGIRNLSLAPNGVQTYVHPTEGNDGVLGHDLMTDALPEVREDVARAMQTGTIVLSGPYELRQGGLGLVVRLAVTYDGEFWGLVTAVLDIPPLLDDAGLTPLNAGVAYALLDGDGYVFVGDDSVLRQDPVTAVVALPESVWTLAAAPVDGWGAAVREPVYVARIAGILLMGWVVSVVTLLAGRERGNLEVAQGLARDAREQETAERERERLLAKIQEQALLLERVIDTVPDGVLLLDEWHHTVLTNPAAEQMLGFLAQYEAGEHGALAYLGERSLAEVLTSPPRGLWHEVRTEDHVLEVFACPIAEQPGSEREPGARWVLVLHDATREREAGTRAQEKVRSSALGQMAAGMARDLDNILAVVVLYTQMGLRVADLDHAAQERLQAVLDQTERATALVQQILDSGGGAPVELQETDLVGLLEEETALLQRTLPESIVVTFTHSGEPCTVNADPRRLQLALLSLSVNAQAAMPGGGELRLAVSTIEVDATSPPPLAHLSEGRWVQITVEDTGDGIPTETVSRIFEAPDTPEGPRWGSGLELAQVYGIVQQHDGQIGVTSGTEQGTRFTICLPAVRISVVGDELADLRGAPRGKGELVLLVEDHAATRVALTDSLELLNYRVVTASHGGEALAVLDDHAHGVAIVLSDYVMPEVNGRELFLALKSRGFPVPMAILTGHPMTAELDDLVAEGLSGWLQKPPVLARVAHLLARALGR